MNSSHRTRFFAPLALVLFFLVSPVGAQTQTNLFLTLNVTTNAVANGSTFTYTMFVTNISTFNVDAFVTNSFSGPVRIVSTTSTLGTNSVSSNRVVFTLTLPGMAVLPQLSVTVTATNIGFITNQIALFEADVGAVVASGTIVHQVTNTTVSSDLAVSILGPSVAVYSNDWTTYQIVVTNSGASVANVMLTNTLPPYVGVLSTSPTNVPATNNPVIFSLGTMTNGASRTFTLQIQPTNSGIFIFNASVGGAALVDTNPTNNFATTNLSILDFVPASLTASNVTEMVLNPSTGLMEQTVRLYNAGTGEVASVRLMVTGVTNLAFGSTNWLDSAVGTNNGNPFVIYGQTLNPEASVDLVLEYFIRSRTPISVGNSNYAAVAVAAADFTSISGTNGSFDITLFTNLPDGSKLIEFGIMLTGRTYTVLYSDSLGSTTMQAQPSIVAHGNRVQWIDSGPPKTVSHPSNAPSRFYRVRLEP